ncbi:MAG: flavodoxin-dependent (E)-4-hydroxy-3-methylbut-2-enyl-diphosphate synthase [Clostridia bacterium]|nr:flavodoxin-dependent (E)-4-hydroxy-3-methylbut-2-enyl-diphosphate synthase [Clostridia bacterium]
MSQKQVTIGPVVLGGGRIAVQSMTTERTGDVEKSVAQILRLEEAGCDIVRVAVPEEEDARAISKIKERIHVPIVADVHFSARLAVLAVEFGADKLRVNPGNIGGEREISLVADCLKAHKIPVRVGANTGSIEPHFLQKYGRSAEALVLSALENVRILEKKGISDIVVSVKASDVPLTVQAYTLLASRCPYPLHLGVTEAGTERAGILKSAVGIGSLLLNGIGDTIRVALTADPVKEVEAAHDILRACGLETDYAEVVSCPTCGRCSYDCMGLAERVSDRVKSVRKKLKIAVMGCVVNGPGEAKGCDLGIAGGKEYCVIIEKGKENERVRSEDAERAFFARLEELIVKGKSSGGNE